MATQVGLEQFRESGGQIAAGHWRICHAWNVNNGEDWWRKKKGEIINIDWLKWMTLFVFVCFLQPFKLKNSQGDSDKDIAPKKLSSWNLGNNNTMYLLSIKFCFLLLDKSVEINN